MNITIPITIKITIDKRSKDAPYIAYSPEFDVASCGPSEEKARKNLKTSIKIVLEETQKHGHLEDMLIELGFHKDKQGWNSPRVSFETFHFPAFS